MSLQVGKKFQEMMFTAEGSPRAKVTLESLKTLWFNTGTLCNLECANCYIESSPKNDRLSFLNVEDIIPYLEEIRKAPYPVELIGLTGGEPFINPHIISVLKAALEYGHEVLVLTNATKILKRHHESLLRLKTQYPKKIKIRVSLDHHTKEEHDTLRGKNTFEQTLEQLQWLNKSGFDISIAARTLTDEDLGKSRLEYQELLKAYDIELNIEEKLVIFPEMNEAKEVPEISVACWDILKKSPSDQMCATERMIVKRKGEEQAIVMPCTLLAYQDQFILGHSLAEANKEVFLNHKFCAQFCVLGGASCSSAK